jgi:hypothetical protein
MRKRYHCPKHKEATPSAVVYGDHWFCFGCGAKGRPEELGLDPNEPAEPEYLEDLEASLDYIRSLPKREIRGFQLHANDRGYYLVWPNGDYYKFRSTTNDTPGGKYRGPAGHKKPPFVAMSALSHRLVLVEGEFNAMSLALVEPRADIVSPGGAGDFYSRSGQKYLGVWATYGRVDLVMDADAPGAQAAIEAKSRLLVVGCPDVRIHLVERDFNDVLVQEGKEALRKYAERLGLL